MPDDPPQPATPASPALDRDLYCLTCGYNLRGLSGDPVRCPECGNLNPIGDVEIPAEIIRLRIRQMETSPAMCVTAVILGLPLLMLFGLLVIAMAGYYDAGPLMCIGLPTLAMGVLWVYGAARFRESCMNKPGWATALAMYHVWGLSLIVTTVGGPSLAFWLLAQADTRIDRIFPGAGLVVFLICIAGVVALCLAWVPWLYRLATARLAPLQREVAVTIARDEIRKKLARQHKHLFG